MERKKNFTEPGLLAPFRLLTSVIRYKCSRCGNISEINLASAKKFIKVMEMLGTFPEITFTGERDFKDYYFEIGYCGNCRHRSQERKLSIKLKVLKQELK